MILSTVTYLECIGCGSTHFQCPPPGDDARFSLETPTRRRHTNWMQYLVELHRLVQLDDGYVVVIVPGIVLRMRDNLGHLAIYLLHVGHLPVMLQQSHRDPLPPEAVDAVRGGEEELVVQQGGGAVEPAAVQQHGHPRVLVHLRLLASDDPLLDVRDSAETVTAVPGRIQGGRSRRRGGSAGCGGAGRRCRGGSSGGGGAGSQRRHRATAQGSQSGIFGIRASRSLGQQRQNPLDEGVLGLFQQGIGVLGWARRAQT